MAKLKKRMRYVGGGKLTNSEKALMKAMSGGGSGFAGNLKGLNLSKIAKSAKVAPKKKSKPSLSTFKKSSGLSKKKKKR